MSLAGLQLSAQYSQISNWATPISNATLALDTLEGAIAQAAAQLVWIGEGYPAVDHFKASPHIAMPLFNLRILQRDRLAHPMVDLTWAMGWLIPSRRSLHYASMSV
jgi:hypothetical protein